MRVTRDVVSDLWPLYEAGEASPATRALVDEYLREDPEYADTMRHGTQLPPLEDAVDIMKPDIETRAFARTRALVRGHAWLRGLRLIATVLSIFAISRIIMNTTWTNDGARRMFAGESVAATVAWAGYVLWLSHERRKALKL
jgi:hypothetical protein